MFGCHPSQRGARDTIKWHTRCNHKVHYFAIAMQLCQTGRACHKWFAIHSHIAFQGTGIVTAQDADMAMY
jgi:hypothetical protein